MSKTSITNILNDKHPFLIRYVKPSYINRESKKVGEEIFQLREDRLPPEEYISFFHSTKITINEKIDDVKLILEKRKFKIKKTSGFLFLNAIETLMEINITRKIISFREEGYPHYGMYYESDEDIDIQEAKTVLLYHQELYLNEDFSSNEKLIEL